MPDDPNATDPSGESPDSVNAEDGTMSDPSESVDAQPVDAQAGEDGGGASGAAAETAATSFEFAEFDSVSEVEHGEAMSLLADVSLDVTIELGRTRMTIDDVLKLSDGAVVELDKLAGDPLDIYVNERLVARGEVLVLNDTFSVRVSEILDAGAIEEAGRAQRGELEQAG